MFDTLLLIAWLTLPGQADRDFHGYHPGTGTGAWHITDRTQLQTFTLTATPAEVGCYRFVFSPSIAFDRDVVWVGEEFCGLATTVQNIAVPLPNGFFRVQKVN